MAPAAATVHILLALSCGLLSYCVGSGTTGEALASHNPPQLYPSAEEWHRGALAGFQSACAAQHGSDALRNLPEFADACRRLGTGSMAHERAQTAPVAPLLRPTRAAAEKRDAGMSPPSKRQDAHRVRFHSARSAVTAPVSPQRLDLDMAPDPRWIVHRQFGRVADLGLEAFAAAPEPSGEGPALERERRRRDLGAPLGNSSSAASMLLLVLNDQSCNVGCHFNLTAMTCDGLDSTSTSFTNDGGSNCTSALATFSDCCLDTVSIRSETTISDNLQMSIKNFACVEVLEFIGPFLSFSTAVQVANHQSSCLRELKISTRVYHLSRFLPKDTFSQLTALEALRLDGCRIEMLPTGIFDSLVKLQTLTLRHNSLTELPTPLLANLKNLSEFSARGNLIKAVPVDLFRSLSALTVVSLRENLLTALEPGTFDTLLRLLVLNLAGNFLTVLPTGIFDRLTNLHLLHIGDNNLAVPSSDIFSALSSLTWLSLHDCFIESLSTTVFSRLRGLEYLDVSDNLITTIPAGVFDLKNLTFLDVSKNFISFLSEGVFDNLPQLKLLYLGENGMTYFPPGTFSRLSKLIWLDMGDNLLGTMPEDAFRSQQALEGLILHNNTISALPAAMLSAMTRLVAFDIRSNHISQFPGMFFATNTQLSWLAFGANPFRQLSR